MGNALRAQDTLTPGQADTLVSLHSPQKATILSSALPGLGQIYNHRVWKVPILYAGFGTIIYFIDFNNKQYNRFKMAYLYRTDNDPTTIDKEFSRPEYANVTDQTIKGAMDTYRRWRDMNLIGIAGLYILQVVDANVDAYFYHFDITKDLTLKISPNFKPNPVNYGFTTGLTCLITIK